MAYRWVSVVAGGWLFISAWLFPAPVEVRLIQCIAGAVVFVTAFVAMALDRARRLNTILGSCVMLTPFVFEMRALLTGVNLLAVGLVVVCASVMPGTRRAAKDATARA
jgi:hypothetical protein